MTTDTIQRSWIRFSKTRRLDAAFWIAVNHHIARHGLDRSNDEHVRQAVEAVEAALTPS